jgi:hypothetical protein
MARGLNTRSKIVAALDKEFSIWVRLSSADDYGNIRCYTCGERRHWKKCDAGHFQTRAKYSTRWDKMNVKPQCKKCNMVNGGQQYKFGKRLDQDYGEGTADSVLAKSNQTVKFSDDELLSILAEIRVKNKALLAEW